MHLWKKIVVLFFLFVSNSFALNCRSERGTKEDEFRRVFNNCVNQMEINSSRHSSEDWKDRDYNQRSQWERESKNENRNGRMENRDSDVGERGRNYDNRDGENDKRQNRENTNVNGANRLGNRYNRTSSRNNRVNMNGEDNSSNRGRNGMMNINGRNEQISGRDDFIQTEEMDSDVSSMQYHNYYPSSQSRRYKREKRKEMNSGQRSQYNPHSQKTNNYETNFDKRNSSDNSSKEVDRACILHCFLESLHMTDDRGMPDRYLVTHAFIKDERNEDLQDFIQESIEECFQILDNENTEDKCEFSKNLLTCLTEKGRSNCDNWSEKTSYLFE